MIMSKSCILQHPGPYAQPAHLRTTPRARLVRLLLPQAQVKGDAAPTDDMSAVWQAVEALHDHVTAVGAAYMFTGQTAAVIQGAAVPVDQLQQLQLQVQWDLVQNVYERLSQQQLTVEPIIKQPGQLMFKVETQQGLPAEVYGQLNTVLAMNTHRVATARAGRQLWCESLLSVRSSSSSCSRSSSCGTLEAQQLAAQVTAQLLQMQHELTAANSKVWGKADVSDAWSNKLGDPTAAATWLQQDPLLRLGPALTKHLPQSLSGCRFINLMGSHGSKAVAAALLGAEVTCVDVSASNVSYGRELAAAAGVAERVKFVVADVLQLPKEELTGAYDVVLLELGVLHYFIDLLPLMEVAKQLLRPGGLLLLRDFHPVSTKLITSKGKKHKVTGNYFSQDVVATDVAYSKYNTCLGPGTATCRSGDDGGSGKEGSGTASVRLRQWNLGEVVTAAAAAGLVVQCLEEEAGVKLADYGLPKLFTLVAVNV